MIEENKGFLFSSFFPAEAISPLLYSEDYDKLSFGNRQLYLTQRHIETNVCGKQTIVFNGKAWRKNGQRNRLLCGKEQGSTGGAFEGGGSQAAYRNRKGAFRTGGCGCRRYQPELFL